MLTVPSDALTRTWDCVLMCPMSAPTPAVPKTSYRRSSPTAGWPFSSSASGWPMPPAAPSTATLKRGSPLAAVALRCSDACGLPAQASGSDAACSC